MASRLFTLAGSTCVEVNLSRALILDDDADDFAFLDAFWFHLDVLVVARHDEACMRKTVSMRVISGVKIVRRF